MEENTEVTGLVVEALPGTLFRVTVENHDTPSLAYLSGRMRLNRIRVLVGDRVLVHHDEYGGKGRIIKRL